MKATVGQALVRFLAAQRVARDGDEHEFFAGVFGIFGHGNVAGIGEALLHRPAPLRFYLPRNEQAMVHTAAAFAKANNRLRAFACTSSIGPGATNMLTGAAGATINRLPVLLLPGDIFATRVCDPVLQQLESPSSKDVSVNDCFKPVSKYWDRINRPEQLPSTLLQAMRVLTSPAETGAVTLAVPQDVQAEAADFPDELFAPRVWRIPRARPDEAMLAAAADLIRASSAPLIVAGGGVHYSAASAALDEFARATGIPVSETQAGKSALPFDHPQAVGAIGATGGFAANRLGHDADLVLAIGTRLTDFTTASGTAFSNGRVRVITINVTEADAYKHGALPLVGDARTCLEELGAALKGWRVAPSYSTRISEQQRGWNDEVGRLYRGSETALMSQAQVIGVLNEVAGPEDVVICAAGSLPGDLHKLWRSSTPGSYHLEYGYSCMGYEIAAGLGVKLAQPSRGVFVLVGDGSYLMMAQEIATAVQEGVTLTILVLDNQGFGSIGGLSAAVGCSGFGTRYRKRTSSGELDGPLMEVDFVANANSLGARAVRAESRSDVRLALDATRGSEGVHVIVIPVDREQRVCSYDSWWDVPVAAVSPIDAVRRARAEYETGKQRQRSFL